MGLKSELRRRAKGQMSAFTIDDARLGNFSPVPQFGQAEFKKTIGREKMLAQLRAGMGMSDFVAVTPRPNDVRPFVHKRVIGAIGGGLGAILSGGNPITAAGRGFIGGGNRSRFAASCPAGFEMVNGRCQRSGFTGATQRFLPGGQTGFLPQGEAVMGQYGAAMVPVRVESEVLDCLPGMILGKDELCYNKGDISNKERKWPKGRRPLGTPGEMAALAKAASFGRRMETTVKRMQKIGVLKKPSSSRKAAPKRLMPGHSDGVRVVNVE